MGLLVDGRWQERWYDTGSTGGRFKRQDSAFRDAIEPDPNARFPAAPGRYHLYVSLACPWAHRTLIVRRLKRLEDAIPVSVVDWYMGDQGWRFTPKYPDHVAGRGFLHEVYTAAKPDYTGRVTVPVLWDTESGTIVNNESSEIIRMFNAAFDAHTDSTLDLYPEGLRAEIDRVNASVYDHVNNGVYKCGFATTQEAYEEAFDALFATLDDLEARLGERRYLCGDRITEADWRLFTTLVRFDAVYVGHFKCNRQRIADYPNLSGYLRELYQIPAIAETCDFHHIKSHYYGSHESINPTRIVAKGPALDLTAAHGRDRL